MPVCRGVTARVPIPPGSSLVPGLKAVIAPPTPAELRRHFVPGAPIALPRATLERREAAGPVTACAEGGQDWSARDLGGTSGPSRTLFRAL